MILAPYGQIPGSFPNEIGYAYGGSGTFLCEQDPQFHQNGEYGMYYDTPLGRTNVRPSAGQRFKNWMLGRKTKSKGLGSIPTDAELATIYGYTPVNSGWIASNQGYVTGPWVPPNGYRPAGQFGPPTSLNGFGDGVLPPAITQPASATDVLMVLNEHNQKMFTLTVVSTIVAGLAAMLAIYRTSKSIKES
jgi:hypothetical protein